MSVWDWVRETWQGWFPDSPNPAQVPAKGRWLSADDPEVAELHRRRERETAEQSRREALKNEPLSKLLQHFQGDLAAALAAKMFTSGEPIDQIEVISDGHLCGNLNDVEFALLKHLPKLRRIYLRGVGVTDQGLAVLAQMPQVEELLLEYNWNGWGLTDDCFQHIGQLPRLKQLSLDRMRITGTGLARLRYPKSLQDLALENSPIADKEVAQVKRFPNLEQLRLENTSVTDDGMKHLGECQALIVLELDAAGVSDQGLAYLVKIPTLEALRLEGTPVTDACLPALLKMPRLQEVTFGDGISVSTIESLKAKGIEVTHGQVAGLRRETNVLRYAGTDYEVDRQRSALRAYLQPDADGVSWQLEIECTDAYVPEYTQPAHLEGPPMSFGAPPWRDLAGCEIRINYDASAVHPIMPDNPCNIYTGHHACPNDHHIQVKSRRGASFLIEWTCIAKQYQDDPGEPIYLLAEIPFKEVVVWSDDEGMSEAQAIALVERHFSREDLGPPEFPKMNHSSRIVFPVRAVD